MGDAVRYRAGAALGGDGIMLLLLLLLLLPGGLDVQVVLLVGFLTVDRMRWELMLALWALAAVGAGVMIAVTMGAMTEPPDPELDPIGDVS